MKHRYSWLKTRNARRLALSHTSPRSRALPYCCLALALLLSLTGLPASAAEEEKDTTSFTRKQVVALFNDCLISVNRAKDVLRLVDTKLPSAISDNLRFRKLDDLLDLCRDETYPAAGAAESLKSQPRNLRELVRLYTAMRLLQVRCLLLADRLAEPSNTGGAALSLPVIDIANKMGRLTLKMHPYLYKVIDAYQSGCPESKLDLVVPLDTEEVQGPVL